MTMKPDDAPEWLAASHDLVAAWTATTGLLMRMGDGETVTPEEVAAVRQRELRALLDVLAAMAGGGSGGGASPAPPR